MFRAFNLQAGWNQIPQKLFADGLMLKQANAEKVRRTLEFFLNKDGTVDASLMQSAWFPQINAQIFISHSHKDEDTALALAGWLSNNMHLTSFIDSCVWGHADDLLKEIDDRCCLNDDNQTYSYESRNGSTSHVHMMLATALAKMIDNTECIFFLNTPNSIKSREAATKTKSPWIFSEIATMQLVRRRTSESHREQLKLAEDITKREARARFQPLYTLDMTSLTPLSGEFLEEWRTTWRSEIPRRHALDVLYELVPE